MFAYKVNNLRGIINWTEITIPYLRYQNFNHSLKSLSFLNLPEHKKVSFILIFVLWFIALDRFMFCKDNLRIQAKYFITNICKNKNEGTIPQQVF